MREIRTAIEIDAPPAVVWEVLSSLESYREWNPYLVAATGEVQSGETIDLTIRPTDGRRRSQTARVTTVDPPHHLEWVGRIFATGLFEGRHIFELHALGDGRTRLVNRERFRGLLVPLLVAEDAEGDYVAMNRALAKRAERRVAVEGWS